MDLNTTWIGIAVGGGAAVVVGAAGHIVEFVNCANPAVTITAVVGGFRLGGVVHGGGNLSVAVLAGISNPQQLDLLTDTGWDFAIELGGKWGEVIKTGSKTAIAAHALKEIVSAKNLAKFLGTEGGKNLVNTWLGELEVTSAKPSFAMFGTPVGLGLGVGVWYEWQVIAPLGSMAAWAYMPIEWRLLSKGLNVWIQARGLPAEDDTELILLGKRFSWGIDGIIDFLEPKSPPASPVKRLENYTSARVKNYQLWETTQFQNKYAIEASPDIGGINLSQRGLGSVRSPLFGNSYWTPQDGFVDLGLAVRTGGKLVWESRSSASLLFSHYKVSSLTPTSEWRY